MQYCVEVGGRKLSPIFLFFFLFLSSNLAFAYDIAPTLDRPQPFDFDEGGRLELWGQYDVFSPQLDFMNFASKTGTSSKIDKHTSALAGVNYGLSDHVHVRYRYLRSKQHATRLVEPTSIDTKYTGHQINAEYTWFTTPNWHLTADVGYRSHKADRIEFFRYKSGNVTIASLSATPVVAFESSDEAYTLGGKAAWRADDDLYITLGLETRRVTVQALFQSSLLNDAVVGPSLKKEAPQSTPWHELHIIPSLSIDWGMFDWLTVSVDAKYYRITRSNYIPKKGKKDLNSNYQLDGYLFARLPWDLTWYAHGRVYKNYLLGDVPMTYNTRTNHRFGNPYGFVSTGLSWLY